MFTPVTQVVSAAAGLWAACYLWSLHGDRATRTARWFTAAALTAWAGFYLAASVIHPLDRPAVALVMGAISRGLFVWLCLGIVMIVQQRRRLLRMMGRL